MLSRLPLLLLILLLLPAAAPAMDVEANLVKSLQLPEPARVLALSADGQQMYVLGQGKVYLYAIQGDLLGEITVPEDVTDLQVQGPRLILLTRGEGKVVDYLTVELIQQIEIGDSPVKGKADAPVTIVVFSDFQCPYCAKLLPELQQVEKLYPEQVKVVFKHFPLSMHQYAQKAAAAAIAAGKQGKFWEMHDQLFANYNRLTDAKVEEIAGGLQLDMEQFRKDWQDPQNRQIIQRDLQLGQQVQVRGTPTVYINGRLLQDRSLGGFRRLIEQGLQEKQPASK